MVGAHSAPSRNATQMPSPFGHLSLGFGHSRDYSRTGSRIIRAKACGPARQVMSRNEPDCPDTELAHPRRSRQGPSDFGGRVSTRQDHGATRPHGMGASAPRHNLTYLATSPIIHHHEAGSHLDRGSGDLLRGSVGRACGGERGRLSGERGLAPPASLWRGAPHSKDTEMGETSRSRNRTYRATSRFHRFHSRPEAIRGDRCGA